MFFANPIALYGLLALAVPILLHLERRRITRRLPFAFVDFLLDAQKHRFWSLKVQQLLLLFLRLLVIALVVLALAQLNVRVGAAGRWWDLLGGAPRSGVVLLVDVSPSMSAREGGRSRLDAARQLAESVLSTIDSQSDILLLPFADGIVGDLPLFTRSRERAREGLAQLAVAGRDTHLLESAEAAARRLEEYAAGTVFILSDFAPRPTEALARGAAALLERHPSVAFLLVPVPLGKGNLAVGDVDLSRLPLLAGETGEAGITLANFGSLDAPGLVERWSVAGVPSASQETRFRPNPAARGGIVRHRFMLASPRAASASEISAHFQLSVEEGFDYPDAIAADNEASVVVPILPRPRVLVVADNPEGLAARAYRALLSGEESAPIAAESEFIAPATLADALTTPRDILILLEETPGAWNADAVARAQEHLRQGRGLLYYPASSGAGRFLSALGVEAGASVTHASLETAPPDDPFTEELAEISPELWGRVDVRAARALSGLDRAWLRAADGHAVLAGVKRALGGQIVVVSVGLSLEDSTLAVSPAFVIGNQVAFKYLLDPDVQRAPRIERMAVTAESDVSPPDPALLENLSARGFGLLSATPDTLSAAPFDTGRYRSLTGLLLWLALVVAGLETWLANRV
ncbi:BatA domain-containing protein [bacterium]|nr:BatA domain-containing protein [bacterium]